MTKTETLLEIAFEDGRAWAQTGHKGEAADIVFAESMAYARTLTDASDPQIFEIRRRFFEGANYELYNGDWTDCQ